MMILFFGLLSLVSLVLGLYTRSARPSARLRKWLGRRETWSSTVFMAGAYAALAGLEYIKSTRPRFYSAHEMVFFGSYVAAVVLAGAVWMGWNLMHKQGAV